MRYLGIDYGEKRIGLALSDEAGKMAFPKEVLENGPKAIGQIGQMVKEESVGGIIVGESVNSSGRPNYIMKAIEEFAEKARAELCLPVNMQKEFFTTVEARRLAGSESPADANAAALILQRYLDKINK